MERRDVVRLTEAKYSAYVEQIVARLKSLPGDVWLHFAGGMQGGDSVLFQDADRQVGQVCLEVIRSCSEPELKLLWFGCDAFLGRNDDNPNSRAAWEEGALKELHERVKYAAGDAGLGGAEKEDPGGDVFEAGFRFEDDDLVFLSKVARALARLTAQPGLAPEKTRAIRRAVAALQKLPQPMPGTDIQIEVSHRMGGEGFSENYSYAIKLDQRRIEIASSGSQSDSAGGSQSFSLESLKWHADGQAAHEGNRDTWLERLAYALGRNYSVNVTDKSGGGSTETV